MPDVFTDGDEVLSTTAKKFLNNLTVKSTVQVCEIEVCIAVRMMMSFWVSAPVFQRNMLSPSSGLKWQCWEVKRSE
jgi:hypothetical protein